MLGGDLKVAIVSGNTSTKSPPLLTFHNLLSLSPTLRAKLLLETN